MGSAAFAYIFRFGHCCELYRENTFVSSLGPVCMLCGQPVPVVFRSSSRSSILYYRMHTSISRCVYIEEHVHRSLVNVCGSHFSGYCVTRDDGDEVEAAV